MYYKQQKVVILPTDFLRFSFFNLEVFLKLVYWIGLELYIIEVIAKLSRQ